jgi:DNA-directed RNA polymerase specialized sigma24 family protein
MGDGTAPMKKHPPVESTPATREEIEQAIEGLTEPQLVRLGKIAAFRHRSLGTRGAGRNDRDLLSDAVIATLEGRRKWFKAKVDFVTFLKGVMRSLASHIRAGKALDAFDEIAPNPVNDEVDTEDFVEQIPTQAPIDPERQLLAGDLDRQIREHFNDDPEVLLIYEAFLEKMKPAEVQACLGLTEKEYNAAAKRLRRAVRAFVEGGPR